jgi:predicted membrane protein
MVVIASGKLERASEQRRDAVSGTVIMSPPKCVIEARRFSRRLSRADVHYGTHYAFPGHIPGELLRSILDTYGVASSDASPP